MTNIHAVRQRLHEFDLLGSAEKIARHHNVTIDEMLSDSHERAPSWARQAFWAALYALGHWSYPRLGRVFERDHVTIRSGVQAHLRRTGEAA